MKKLLLVFVLCVVFSIYSQAQPPPPPPPGTLSGANAPIDTDIAVLLIITTLYGTFKIYSRKKSLLKIKS